MVQLRASESMAYQESASSQRNGAAVLSLVCAVLWPLSFLAPAVFNMTVGKSGLPDSRLPDSLVALLQLDFAVLPVVGAIAGVIGLYRALQRPPLRKTLWQAIVGLAFGCMWIAGVFVLSFAGAELTDWVTHLTL